MKKMLFVMNPYAGMRRASRYVADIIALFNRAGYQVITHMTGHQGDGVQVVEQLAKDVDLVVCTNGSKGSTARMGDEVLEIPVVKADRVVDATGAGDSYRAGFYTALYKGRSIPDALVIASSVASFVVEKTGALTNIPTWDAVMERAEPYMREVA